MAKFHSLEHLSTYGCAVLVELVDAEMSADSEVRDAAIALHRYRLAASDFAKVSAEIAANQRFSAEGRAAELGDYCVRGLNELGRHDALLARAQALLDELQAEARKVPVDQLSPMQVALVPGVYARLAAMDPLELPALLEAATSDRDTLMLATFLAAPRAKPLRLPVSDEQLDAAREAAAGPLPAERRRVLNRLRELVAAAQATRKALVAELKRGAGLEQDPLARLLGVELPTKQERDDPIAAMARGEPAPAA